MEFKRRIFLINKPFQLRFSFYLCSWVVGLGLVYPLIIYSLFEFFIRSQTGVSPDPARLAKLQEVRHEILTLLILAQAIFLGATFLISVFLSHRIAGPLFKLKRFLKGAEEGRFSEVLKFRRSDHFHDLADSYNSMVDGIRVRRNAEQEAIAQVIARIDRVQQSAGEPARKELQEALNGLRALQSKDG